MPPALVKSINISEKEENVRKFAANISYHTCITYQSCILLTPSAGDTVSSTPKTLTISRSSLSSFDEIKSDEIPRDTPRRHSVGPCQSFKVSSFSSTRKFLCLRPIRVPEALCFRVVRPSVCTGISLPRNLKNPLVDIYHPWPRGAP